MMSSSRLQQLNELLKNEPDDSFLNYALALEYAKAGDTSNAIITIEKVLEKDGDYLGAYYQLGQYYEEAGYPEKAIQTYRKGITIARQQKNQKTLGELNTALMQLEEW